MGAIATFSYSAWLVRYPEFTTTVNEQTADAYFNEATLYLANDGTGPVTDPPPPAPSVQLMLLNMLTAHIAQLNSGSSIQPLVPLVGRINTATEGSVSVGAELPGLPGTAAWYSQTRYGLSFYQATAAYRTFRYRPGPRRVFDPLFQRRFF